MIFKSLVDLVFYIVFLYVKQNPTADINDVINTFSPLIFKTCDMNRRYPFIKSSRDIIASRADNDRFSREEIVINGIPYRISAEWKYKDEGKIEIDNLIKFAKDVLDVDVIYSKVLDKLKSYDDSLISFYIAETKSVLTKQQYDNITKVKVTIDETDSPCFEIVGRYDLRETIDEIIKIIESSEDSILEFKELLQELLHILWKIIEIEPPVNELKFDEQPFTLLNASFGFMSRIDDLDREMKLIIEKIREMLNECQWPKETRKLIEDILKRIWPKIVARKRLSIVLGKFKASDNRITLYQSAIENWLPEVDYFEKLLDVYSHELFHAFHYIHMKNANKWEYNNNSRMVKESLARYIEYRFGLINNCETAISADLIRMWNDYDMYDFPYAGAKYVDKFSGLCELMFKDSTKNGTTSAFHLLDHIHNL